MLGLPAEDEDDDLGLPPLGDDEPLGVADGEELDLLPELPDGSEEVGLDDQSLGEDADPSRLLGAVDLGDDEPVGGDVRAGDDPMPLDLDFGLGAEEDLLGEDVRPMEGDFDLGLELVEEDAQDDDGGSEGVEDFGIEGLEVDRAPLAEEDEGEEGLDELERDLLRELGL